jgi:hypothetical protein
MMVIDANSRISSVVRGRRDRRNFATEKLPYFSEQMT